MIWRVILHNLAEAHGELESLLKKLCYLDSGKMPEDWRENWDFHAKGLSREVMAVQFAHIYHHVNWAWNCRNADENRAIRCSRRDFRRWEKFPKDWPELWLPPSRCGKRFPKWRSPAYRWAVKRPSKMRRTIYRAEHVLGYLVVCVAMRVGDEFQARWNLGGRFDESAEPITEEMFAGTMRHLYTMLNIAWNSRNLDRAQKMPRLARYFRYLRCFPRSFPDFWPITITR